MNFHGESVWNYCIEPSLEQVDSPRYQISFLVSFLSRDDHDVWDLSKPNVVLGQAYQLVYLFCSKLGFKAHSISIILEG